ncbi:MAG TPA: DUF6569 family protein [Pyrinomonadaceae bacterium]|nr:DUF6569 family protein [Pyrinomonadaceae bacterium]
MNRRTFAFLTAVITFTAGVAIAKLSLPNLFKASAPAAGNQLSHYRLSGPYRFERLSIFLVHGANAPNSRLYMPLQFAMLRDEVSVHETNRVNELEIENISYTEEVFVQAGDIVKGGNQDRVLSVDFILPSRSGRLLIPAFCVESSRWYPRGAEQADHFTITEMSAGFSLRRAIKEVATQAGVWDEVAASQEKLSAGVASNVRSTVSPTSLALAMQNDEVQKAAAPYIDNLSPIVESSKDVIGFAFAINDNLKGADVYSSNQMFKRLWPRLLKAAAVEAISEGPIKYNESPTIETVSAFLANSETGAETISNVNWRTQSAKRETEQGLFFETRDMEYRGAWIHRTYLHKTQ